MSALVLRPESALVPVLEQVPVWRLESAQVPELEPELQSELAPALAQELVSEPEPDSA